MALRSNELMIGDWVYCEGQPAPNNVIIQSIHEDGVWFQGEEFEGAASYDRIFPIPITPEILEKNGFIYKDVAHNNFRGVWVCNVGRCNNVFIQVTDKVLIEIHNELGRKDEKGRADLVSFCRDWCEVLFVHELQHTLRLCGIDKTIEL